MLNSGLSNWKYLSILDCFTRKAMRLRMTLRTLNTLRTGTSQTWEYQKEVYYIMLTCFGQY